MLAKIPREMSKTKDITGGLPRVVELFEARKPKDPAVVSEIDGVVRITEPVRGQRRIVVEGEGGEHREYSIPRYAHVSVQEGEFIQAGDPLTEGPVNPHDILSILGEKEMQRHLVDKIQEVYRSQGVTINDKHIEVIVRQMMRFVKVVDPGDTDFLLDEQVPRYLFRAGERAGDRGRRRAGDREVAAARASPRPRWPPSRSSRRPPSRRPPGCSPRRRSRARWTTCTGSRRTSSSAG